MANEKEWVRTIQPLLEAALQVAIEGTWMLRVAAGKKLTYADEILQYGESGPKLRKNAMYETDLLIYDVVEEGLWIPRVVIECKTFGVTTHDALTYSAKAATHKHLHPYLWYGVLIGDFGDAVPGRLIRHGAYFDFMMVWPSQQPSPELWAEFIDLLKDELNASRTLHRLVSDSRSRARTKCRLLHRPLRLS